MVEIVKNSAASGEEDRVPGNAARVTELNPGLNAAWDGFVAQHANPQFLQTSAWAALKSRYGWQATRSVVHHDVRERAGRPDTLLGGASILLRGVAGLTVAYVPRGPVVDWRDHEATARVISAVADRARQAGASVLIVEPELPDSPSARLLLARLGFTPTAQTVQPPSTIQLDISGDEDAVLARNGFDNLQVIPAAVSDRAETLQFIQAGPYGLVATPFQNDPTITVQAKSVDEMLATLGWDRVDFIKLDVEGSEVKAVAGMKKLLSREDAPTILYESNGHTLHYFGQTPTSLMAALESYGYRCYLVEAGQLTPVSAAELQFNCTVDYLATKQPLASLSTLTQWSITPPFTRQAQVSQILATAAEAHPHLRSYIARTLENAPLRLLADARVLWMLDRLAKDADARVRQSAAWFPANLRLPFATRHSKIAALQRYLALALYALKGRAQHPQRDPAG